MRSKVDELAWRFVFHKTIAQDGIDKFIEEFVFSYVEKNNWYCGGGTYMGMYDLDGNTSAQELKVSLLEYLSKHTDIVKGIIVHDYDEKNDELIPIEEIQIC